MKSDIIIREPHINNQQSKYCLVNLKYILDQSKQSIYEKKYDHPTGTLPTTSLKPVCGGGGFICLVWIRSTDNFYYVRVQVSVSMNNNPGNSYKEVKINNGTIKIKTQN